MMTPVAMSPPRPMGWPPTVAPASVSHLGWGLAMDAQGNYRRNDALIEALVRQGPAVVPPLFQMLQTSLHRGQLLEGLYLAQRLAESRVPNVRQLYAAAARLNYTTDPDLQSYLAGFYRALNQFVRTPETFGPMLEMLMRQSQVPRPPQAPMPRNNPMEEVGGTVLQQLAEQTADVVLNRLKTQPGLLPTVPPSR